MAGLSTQRANEDLKQITELLHTDEANIWFIPITLGIEETSVECIWYGDEYNKFFSDYKNENKPNINEINSNLLELLLTDVNIDENERNKIKGNIRLLKLKNIIDSN